MTTVRRSDVPKIQILERFREGPMAAGTWIDCYSAEVPGQVSLAQFVESFYTTPVFKAERVILRLVNRPSTDDQARRLARGETTKFSAWTTHDRTETELLMCDMAHRTMSWFRVSAVTDSVEVRTRLDFGTVIVPQARSDGSGFSIGLAFKAFMPLHKLYARLLLRSAVHRI